MRKQARYFLGLGLMLGVVIWASPAQPVENDAGPGTPSMASNKKADSAKAGEKQSGAAPSFSERRPRYRLAPGDVLDLNFPFTPEFNQTLTIQPDGFITLRDLGEIYAQGKTAPELAAALHEAYGKILHDPVVTVDLKDFQKPYFIAGGEVRSPGRYDLRQETTVTEALAIAGGLTRDSKNTQVVLFRRVSENLVEARKLNIKKMLSTRNLQEDVYLRPGDMLYVPKNRFSKIDRFLPTSALSLYSPVH